MNRLIATKYVTAYKSHRCWACGAEIERGETYLREVRVDYGIYTLKLCLPCEDATPQVAAWSYEYEFGPETYAEWAEEAAVHTSGIEQQQALEYLRRRPSSAHHKKEAS